MTPSDQTNIQHTQTKTEYRNENVHVIHLYGNFWYALLYVCRLGIKYGKGKNHTQSYVNQYSKKNVIYRNIYKIISIVRITRRRRVWTYNHNDNHIRNTTPKIQTIFLSSSICSSMPPNMQYGVGCFAPSFKVYIHT